MIKAPVHNLMYKCILYNLNGIIETMTEVS